MTPPQVRRTSLRDAFQVMRGYHRRQRDRVEPIAEMFRRHHEAEELYFARLYTAIINAHAAEKSDTANPKDFLSRDHPAREQMGMSKERLRANYRQLEQDHPDKVPVEDRITDPIDP